MNSDRKESVKLPEGSVALLWLGARRTYDLQGRPLQLSNIALRTMLDRLLPEHGCRAPTTKIPIRIKRTYRHLHQRPHRQPWHMVNRRRVAVIARGPGRMLALRTLILVGPPRSFSPAIPATRLVASQPSSTSAARPCPRIFQAWGPKAMGAHFRALRARPKPEGHS